MAGTIVADTIQDGAGNSTSMDNAIYGSAKAWVTFTYISSVLTTTASYNVSSVTRSAVGQYSVTMTNALVDANYAVVMGGGPATGQTQPSNTHPHYNVATGGYITPTTTVFSLGIVNEQNSSQVDPYTMAIVVHR